MSNIGEVLVFPDPWCFSSLSTTAGRVDRSSAANALPNTPLSPSSALRKRCECASPASSSSTSKFEWKWDNPYTYALLFFPVLLIFKMAEGCCCKAFPWHSEPDLTPLRDAHRSIATYSTENLHSRVFYLSVIIRPCEVMCSKCPAFLLRFTHVCVFPDPFSLAATPPSLPLLGKPKERAAAVAVAAAGSQSCLLSTWPALWLSSLR